MIDFQMLARRSSLSLTGERFILILAKRGTSLTQSISAAASIVLSSHSFVTLLLYMLSYNPSKGVDFQILMAHPKDSNDTVIIIIKANVVAIISLFLQSLNLISRVVNYFLRLGFKGLYFLLRQGLVVCKLDP